MKNLNEDQTINQVCDSPVINKNDCFVRAFAKFTTMPYEKAYSLIKPFQSARGGIRKSKAKEFLLNYYLKWTDSKGTLGKFVREHQKGRFIVFVNNHATVLINGVIHDSALNNLNKRVIGYVNAKGALI